MTDRGKLKYLKKNLSQCHNEHHTFYTNCTGLNLCLSSEKLPPELWPAYFHFLSLHKIHNYCGIYIKPRQSLRMYIIFICINNKKGTGRQMRDVNHIF